MGSARAARTRTKQTPSAPIGPKRHFADELTETELYRVVVHSTWCVLTQFAVIQRFIGGIKMEKRKLGKTGIEVAPVALGGNVFGWTVDEPTSFELFDAFVDKGFNLIDTADMYSNWVPGHKGGESETIIGKWLKKGGKRSKVVIATKVGLDMGEGKKGLSASYIQRAVEDSLRRLQTDHIDLYQAHKDDPDTPLAETLGAFSELIQQGKVRAIGASNYSGQRLAEALELSEKKTSSQKGLARYQTLQPE